MSDVPMIYTSKGNVPLDSVEQRIHWQHAPGDGVLMAEEFRDKATGELVKRSVFIYKFNSPDAVGSQQGHIGDAPPIPESHHYSIFV